MVVRALVVVVVTVDEVVEVVDVLAGVEELVVELEGIYW